MKRTSIHHDAVFNRNGVMIEPALDEEIILDDGEDMEILREAVLELADMVFAEMEREV